MESLVLNLRSKNQISKYTDNKYFSKIFRYQKISIKFNLNFVTMSALPAGPTQAGISTDDIWQTIVTILFALSMISERIANFIKLKRLSLKEFNNREQSKIHERKVMVIALICGEITALLAGADLFTLVQHGQLLGLSALFDFTAKGTDIVQRFLGVILTGVFISLGSKFWHDVLDIVLQFSNLKKYQADTQQAVAKNTAATNNDGLAGLQQQTQLVLGKLKSMSGYMGYEYLTDGAGNATILIQFSGALPDQATSAQIRSFFTGKQVAIQSYTPSPQLQ